jgi:hypothetical protein
MYGLELVWNFSTTALCILFFYKMLLARDVFYKVLATFFPWCILCRRCSIWTLTVLVNTFGKRAHNIWALHVIRDNKPVTVHSVIQIWVATNSHVTKHTYMHEGHIFLNSGTWYSQIYVCAPDVIWTPQKGVIQNVWILNHKLQYLEISIWFYSLSPKPFTCMRDWLELCINYLPLLADWYTHLIQILKSVL